MTDRAFEIAEYERDREVTVRQLRAVEDVPGMGAYREKFTAQLARIEKRLAELRG